MDREKAVAALLEPRQTHPYRKWTGAHWRLVSLTELGVTDQRLLPLAGEVLAWLAAPDRKPRIVGGLQRRHASMEGNAILSCSRIGLAGDGRVRYLVKLLLDSQWPDGGWNCDQRTRARHSSFHETLTPMLGLAEFALASGDSAARDAALRAAEFLLRHRLFRSDTNGRVIDREWLHIHYPPYWHYDVLRALLGLDTLGLLGDQRAAEALELVSSKRLPDGRWRPGGRRYWRPETEAVDWSGGLADDLVTRDAGRVLAAAKTPG